MAIPGIVTLDDLKEDEIRNICGTADANLLVLADFFQCEISYRDGKFFMASDDVSAVSDFAKVLTELRRLASEGKEINAQNVVYTARIIRRGENVDLTDLSGKIIGRTLSGKPVSPRTKGQLAFVRAMEEAALVFAVGPAGTGKTYLAVIEAVTAFKKGDVKRIVLTRPAVEAGENLGFLPGDLKEKVDPYLTPLYDGLYDMLGREQTDKLMERGIIEIIPLAYMRGRTLNDSYVILDEAQNTTPSQMKMFLTRLGFRSHMVVTGDVTQIDLPVKQGSGLIQAVDLLKNISEIRIIELSGDDVVRHPLVQKIIERYDAVK